MSHYDWESGQIIIPRDQWPEFKQRLRDAYNKEVEKAFQAATKISDELTQQLKGTRNADVESMFRESYRKHTTERSYGYGGYGAYGSLQSAYFVSLLDEDWHHKIREALLPFDWTTKTRRNRPLKPKRKDFALATGATKRYPAEDGTITLLEKEHAVRWDVGENNGARERARESTMGRALFSALDKIKWKRGSGGVLIGNDEYNRDDSHYEGGGGNYVTARYGPLGDNSKSRKPNYLYSGSYYE